MLPILVFCATSVALSAFAAVTLYGTFKEFMGALREHVFKLDILMYGPFPTGRLFLWLLLSASGSWGLYHVLFG